MNGTMSGPSQWDRHIGVSMVTFGSGLPQHGTGRISGLDLSRIGRIPGTKGWGCEPLSSYHSLS